uniref:Ig-like domain-containing protein n=1 Tax=Leptobrachium leishanense TaxID=445787 RepID=A0A8C5QJH9_9ANUR
MVLNAIAFVFLCLQAAGVYSDSHSYRYFYTGISDTGHGQPLFTATAYVNDFPIGTYTSHTKEFQLQTKWIKEKTDPALWKRNTQVFQGWEIEFKKGVKSLMSHFNHTEGFHTLQWMYGCELHDDGSISGYDLDGYDGREFLALDQERVIHTASLPEAESIAEKWNTETNEAERMKNYLQEQCIGSLRQYIHSGQEHLEMKVAPKVKISEQRMEKGLQLHCHAYGFYPQDIHVKWMRNGREEVPCLDANYVLPNTDGTYQIRVTIHITAEKGDKYFCHIDHSSQKETYVLPWEPAKDAHILIVIGACVSAIALLAAVIAIWRHRRRTVNNNPDYSVSPCLKKCDAIWGQGIFPSVLHIGQRFRRVFCLLLTEQP